MKHKSKNLITGAGHRAGRRPKSLRTDKRELERVLRELSAFGIGSRIIGRMLGFSPSSICNYQNYWNIPHADPVKATEWYESLMPPEIQAAILRIRTKSSVYLERAKNKDLSVPPRIHLLLDKTPRGVQNRKPRVQGLARPKEAA